ncbi:MAG: hypothetical protein N3G78_14110 [Desulfobacterota bacterium]|nr:hypothetical protein [Thermodesulfobacteriota bacterium]
MAERDPIDLIKDQLTQWERLGELNADHDLFKQWLAESRTILEKAFSPRSTHCQNFGALKFREVNIKGFDSPEVQRINSARFKRDLDQAKAILLSALKELTLDRTLFKKLQTTAKTVEVSLKGEYFISSGITDQALRKAIELSFEGSGLTPVAHSSGEEPISLSQRIDQIRRIRIGIFDLTPPGRERSLIELGIALGLGKEVILLSKKGVELPEMVEALPRVEYETPADLTPHLKKKIP